MVITGLRRLALGGGIVVAVLVLVVVASALGSGDTSHRTQRESHVHAVSTATRDRLDSAYGRLPLSFEENRGQADSRVRFLARGGDFTLGLTKTGPLLALYRSSKPVRAAGVAGRARTNSGRVSVRALSIVFAGASARVRLAGTAPLAGRVNYLIGTNRQRWHTNIPTFSGATYRGVWRGIDATFSGSQHSLEYVFTVVPGADPRQIALVYHGQSGLRLDRSGDLLLAAGRGRTVRQLAPHAYQVVGGRRRSVASRYALTGGRVGISVGAYDRSRALVIDPTLDYSTYLGGMNNDFGTAIAVDGSGSAYVTGFTSSTDFPTFPTPGAYQAANAGPGAYDAFVSKLTLDGSALVYSTYLGGGSSDEGQGIAVDSAGSAYITGWASSPDFPTTAGAYQTTNGKPAGSGYASAFVTKLQPNGSALAYSTFLGGSGVQDIGYGIAVDGSGSAYVTGDAGSTDFPTTLGAYEQADAGGRDAFFSKLQPNGSALVYSTYLGGAGTDYGSGIAIDGPGNAYVTGYADSADFPTTAGAYQSANAGGVEAFVSKVDPAGAGNSDLVYSTYLGGTARDVGAGIAVDGSGSAYVTGSTGSTDFPTTAGAYRTTNAGGSNAFVSKLAANGGALAYSTYLGGSQYDWGNGIALDGSGSAYITGHSSSNDFPTTPDAVQTSNPGTEAFVSKLSASGATLAYSTFLGAGGDEGMGIAVDSAGSAYVTGNTFASTFPTTTGAYQTSFGGAYDAFVAKITPPKRSTQTSLSCSPASVTVGSTSTCTATVSDSDAGTKITPTGTISVVSDSAGAFSNPGASCPLAAAATVGTASCTVDYTPSARGSGTHQLTANYGGESTHATSSGSTNLTVTASPGPPSATVTTPSNGATYAKGSVVNANYSCSAGANGGVLRPGASGCSAPVANGSPIDTANAGAHSVSVTATDTDGQTVTTTSNYTVAPAPAPPGPPSATVTTPANGATYTQASVVNANYSCTAGANGGTLKAGTSGCSGPVANASPIDTATVGAHSFAVTATGTDGQTATTTSNYSVTAAPAPPVPAPPPTAPPGPPTVKLITPFDGAAYSFGSVVTANYVCSAGASGGVLKPGIAGCTAPVVSGSPIDTTTFGTRTFTVTATDTDGQSATISIHYTLDYTDRQPTPVRPKHPVILTSPVVDIRVTGIEVNQSVQTINCNCFGTLPSRPDLLGKTPGQATYEGVTMAAGKYTIVRVFAHAANLTNPAATSLRGATATLRIFDSSEREISAPLKPDISPSALTPPDCFACVTERERANATAAFLFVVPWDSTYHRSLTFRATVSTPVGLSAPVLCGGCNANVFTLRGVPFASTADVELYPIPLTVGGVQTTKTVDDVFDSAQTALPVNVNIHPYETPLPIDSLTTANQAAAAVAQRASDEKRNSSQYAIGVYTAGSLGGSGGSTTGGPLFSASAPISVVSDSRPLTSAMHEIGHGLGLVHADTGSAPNATGPHPDGTADCGGNSNKQVGENWPPDNEGRIQGVGLDLRNWTARILDSGYPTSASIYYDFMSYCPGVAGTQIGTVAQNEADHWISVVNWNRLIAFHPPTQSLPLITRRSARTHVAAESGLRVIATVDPAGKTSIFDVAPVDQVATDSTPGSTYRIELRDASGGTIASVVPTTSSVHSDGQLPGVLLQATLPFAPSAASVVVSSGGVVLAQRARSADAPTATIVSPASGTRVGESPKTLVRWTADDADADRLTSAVDYSADGGNQWKVVASGVSGDSVSVPSRLLSASSNARFRVRVSDGFDVATAVSGVLRASGAPPSVHIIGGSDGGWMRADTMLLLRGAAYDDAGTRLTGRSLRWYAGGRLLGRGELLTVHGLPAGTTAVRLVATDAHGRSAQTSLPLKVLAVRPTFLVARAPKHVAPSARRLRIVIASNVPAVLLIAGGRHAVGRTPRALTIAIRPGRAPLRLAYVLRSRGGATRGTYIARR